MEKQYQDRIEQCFSEYKDIRLHQAAHPEDDEYDMMDAQAVCDIESAIEVKSKDGYCSML